MSAAAVPPPLPSRRQPPPLPILRDTPNDGVLRFAPPAFAALPSVLLLLTAYAWWQRGPGPTPSIPFNLTLAALLWLALRALVASWPRFFLAPTHLIARSAMGWQCLRWSEIEAWSVAFDGSLSIRVRGFDEPDRFRAGTLAKPQALIDALSQRIQVPAGAGLRATPSPMICADFVVLGIAISAAARHVLGAGPTLYWAGATAITFALLLVGLAVRKRELPRVFGGSLPERGVGVRVLWPLYFWPALGPFPSSYTPLTVGMVMGVVALEVLAWLWYWAPSRR